MKKVIEQYLDIGAPKFGAELEFFVFSDRGAPHPIDNGGYFRSGLYGEIRKEAALLLNKMNINIGSDHHEVAPSQHEINLEYTDALTMADRIIIAKYIIKKVARKYGLYASFMPKPIENVNGNGMHVHISLWKNDENIFYDSTTKSLSQTARFYIGGLLHYAKDIQAALNQWINSYKRLQPDYEAPTYITWGYHDRGAYIRIPDAKTPQSTRIELRSPDPACNPYLAFALIHIAGIAGTVSYTHLTLPTN